MKGVGIVRATWTACVAIASVAFLAGFVAGQRPIGLGLALGLIVGAGNGELLQRVIDSRAPFAISSVIRMASVSAVAILVALIVGASPIAVLLGVAAAQLVMVGASVREGLRA
ncbi:MAG TPA: hypothetical protein VFB69_07280 [Candidatus Dormibacteraeota bacterium]|nr:hypothetical protein [Candidatus Dormibacteraeota bacterium]